MAERPQTSFSRGVISPSLHGRVDLALYNTALRKLRNMYVRVYGGVTNRAGFQYIGDSKSPTDDAILIPFIFSTEQAYVLEFGAGYIIPYANGAKIRIGSVFNLSGIALTGGNMTFTTTASHGLSVGDVVAVRGAVVTGAFNAANSDFTISAVPTATTFTVPRVSTGNTGGWVSGGTVQECLVLATPYSETDLPDIRYTQSADVLTVMHKDHPQMALSRTSATSFTFEEEVYNDGPFLDLNTDESVYAWSSGETGTVSLYSNGNIFEEGHVGGLFYLEEQDLQSTKPWEPNRKIYGQTYGVLRRSDGKTYKCVTFKANSLDHATGTVQPTHDKGVADDGAGTRVDLLAGHTGLSWEYLHSGYGIARIASYVSPTEVTATVLSRIPLSCVGGIITSGGPWSMTGDGADTTLTITGVTSSNDDPSLYTVYVDGYLLEPNEYSVSISPMQITFVVAPGVGLAVVAYRLDARNVSDAWAFGAWSEKQGYPRTGTYYNDRKIFASTREKPQRVDMSKVGEYDDFGVSTPLVDDDALAFEMGGKRVNAIRDLVALDQLIAITSTGAWRIGAGDNDALTPSTIGFRPQVYRGSGNVPAQTIGDTAVYVSYNGSKLRDLKYEGEFAKFNGSEVSLTAEHLFSDALPIIAMAYAEEPDDLLWVLRSDGALMSVTYLRDQEVIGWAEHETDGEVESLCVIPENGRDVLYVAIRRTVDQVGRLYIERLSGRGVADPRDHVFLDSALTYDGRGDGAQQMYLAASDWTAGGDVVATLTLGQRTFASTDVGNEVWVYSDERIYRGKIVTVYSAQDVQLLSSVDVPSDVQFTLTPSWGIATNEFYGLDHLSGKQVKVALDGLSPDDSMTVNSDGMIETEEYGVVVHAGLPCTAEMETLDINVFGRRSTHMSSKLVQRVAVYLKDSRGYFAGTDAENLSEYAPRHEDDGYEAQPLTTGVTELEINSTYNDTGRILIRQTRPLPLTVLAVIPDVEVGE